MNHWGHLTCGSLQLAQGLPLSHHNPPPLPPPHGRNPICSPKSRQSKYVQIASEYMQKASLMVGLGGNTGTWAFNCIPGKANSRLLEPDLALQDQVKSYILKNFHLQEEEEMCSRYIHWKFRKPVNFWQDWQEGVFILKLMLKHWMQ